MEDSSSCERSNDAEDNSFKASLKAMMSPSSSHHAKHIALAPTMNMKLPSEQVQDILLAKKHELTRMNDKSMPKNKDTSQTTPRFINDLQSSKDQNISLSINPHENVMSGKSLLLNQLSARQMSNSSLHNTNRKDGILSHNQSLLSNSSSIVANPQTLKFHSDNIQKRRSSTRSIKRKKFDDELVESSLIKSERNRGLKSSNEIKTDVLEQPAPVSSIPSEINLVDRKRPFPSKQIAMKQAKRHKPPPIAASTKDLGRWKPQDDLALITNVQQTNDLTAVHLGIKFSCHFTLREVQERWYALLYYPVLSKIAMSAIKQLHPDVIAAIQAKALFCKEEEELMGTVLSTSQPTLEVFDELLVKNPTLFYFSRNSKTLQNHWLLMKQYHLLPDQSVQPMPRGDHVLNFSDAEDLINDDELKDNIDEHFENELIVSDRKQKKEIRHLEQEVPKWQVLVDSVTGVSPPDFDNQTLAVLRGRLVRYLMRSREITLGRATKDNPIDVDLSLEGPAWKISRRQGVIKLRNSGTFYIANEGKRPFYVDGKPILYNNKTRLNNSSVVEISCLRFIFLINQDLINVIRNDTHRISS